MAGAQNSRRALAIATSQVIRQAQGKAGRLSPSGLPGSPAVGLTALAACAQRSDVDAVDRLEDLAPHSSGEEITIGADGIRNPRCRVSRELDR